MPRATSPRVDYFLTDSGKELISIMDAMCGWAKKYLGVAPTLPPRPDMIPRRNLQEIS